MNRLTSQPQAEEIARAFRILPPAIFERLRHVEFLTEDPVWVGLHRFRLTNDQRSYQSTAHCVYPWHQPHLPRSHRATTIALPVLEPAWVIVHELGHALHEVIHFDLTPRPVTQYACQDRYEAFAEAFCAWLLPEYRIVRDLLEDDPLTLAQFRWLAA